MTEPLELSQVSGGIIIHQAIVQGNLIATNETSPVSQPIQAPASIAASSTLSPAAEVETRALQSPRSFADPSFIRRLDTPGGAIRLASQFYVERAGIDDRLSQEVAKDQGTTTTIRGPRQVGKTSLLVRANEQIKKMGRQTVYLDLQEFESEQFINLDTFLHNLATIVVDELSLDQNEVTKAWQPALGPTRKINNLLEKYILPTIETPFILVMDEVDKLLDTSFRDDFFGLVRAWHNRRARNSLWEKLHIIMVISTEPHLLIGNANQSPFNVGLRLELTDFSKAQIHYLDEQYQTGIFPQFLDDCMILLGGHPYLVQQALYTLVVDQLTWTELEAIAPTDNSPFADHLGRYLDLLHRQPVLVDAMKCVIYGQPCADNRSLRHLLRAGLIKKDQHIYTCRCQLYHRYLESRL